LPDALLTGRGLSKTYVTPSGGIEALRSVDVELQAGQLTAIVGTSGSGKSTLLRALAGLDHPTAGALLVGGRDLATASRSDLRRHRRSGATFVSQKPSDNFIPHLTLREHAEDAPAPAQELLAEFGVGDRLDSRPVELSGGEQARAAFALALARGTPLIVVDEPTAELDRATAAVIVAAMQRHAAGGVAFAVATHDADVTAAADRVLRLERGRVVAGVVEHGPSRQKPPAELVDDEVLAGRSLSKSFHLGGERVIAVDDASVALRPGEVGVLLGRSGSGKSTLLTLLAGWQQPDAGEVIWQRRPIDAATLSWSQLAYLPQRFGLLPELTIRENVEYPARLRGTLPGDRSRIERLLEELGLGELADRVPAETSIGQQQRAALARTLSLRPDVLLADEPSSHQDAGFRDRVWSSIAHACSEGTACLIATHEDEAAADATRLWRIEDGTVKAF
jgi:putative ABC transport system ATP-binding protein